MFYTIYKVTNQIDGKFYIGSHKTKDLNDNYMGSGKYLKYAQEKYGVKNFTKEILFVFDNAEQMYSKEAELVNEEFLATENTYNLKIGGFGGFDYLNSTLFNNPSHTTEHSRKMTKRRLEIYSKEERRLWSIKGGLTSKNNKAGIHDTNKRGNFTGKKHSVETKTKMKLSSVGKQKGENNSQFGTMWITNGNFNKKIKKNDLIPEGWKKGRMASW